jgi:hypothetical protein
VILAQVYPQAFGGSAEQLLTLTPAAIAGAGFWTGTYIYQYKHDHILLNT